MDPRAVPVIGSAKEREFFCSGECWKLHGSFGRVLMVTSEALVEKVHAFARDADAGYAATWDRRLRIALDLAGAAP